jgi:SpoVK/Ycf46/Vps4 family AAA+-type ATPase
MRGITKELKLPYLRLDKSSMSHCNDIISILNEMKISCVLMDDIDWMDRNRGMQQLLHLLGSISSMVNLILGSANYVSKLPGALKRPERFDRTFLVEFLDSQVHLKMVNNDNEIFNLTQNWPAVFIKELMKRVIVEGKEKALNEMSDLQERVTELLAEKYSNSQKENNQNSDLEEDDDEDNENDEENELDDD